MITFSVETAERVRLRLGHTEIARAEVEHITIDCGDPAQIVKRPVTDADRAKYAEEYQAWKHPPAVVPVRPEPTELPPKHEPKRGLFSSKPKPPRG